MEETSIFKFDESSQRVAKFPCGMSITATINFHPEDDRDYYHKLVISTNTRRFAIPIVCRIPFFKRSFFAVIEQSSDFISAFHEGIGGRGLLNAPDSIVFDSAPVKLLNTKAIPLCNEGTRPARFSLSTTG
jgi:hypothetical protein